jgi:CheY-like chemotaxis protein
VPALAADVPALAPHASTTSPSHADAGRDVLVVEDNDDARMALCELLRLAGHRVRAERDGAAGLATALAARPEIVLIDIGLPGIDGYEVARRIRAASSGAPRMTLVALTGYGLPEDRTRALEAGFDVHLVKPVGMSALAAVLA